MRLVGIRSFITVTLIASAVCLYVACGGGRVAAMGSGQRGDAVNAGDVEAIRQLGRTMGDAMVSLDMGTLDRIYADDWGAVLKNGKVMTKQEVIESIRSGDHRLLAYELGPIDVQVLGDLAVAHGTVKERRLIKGKPVDMEGVCMDFLKKRKGRWVVFRSGGGMLEPQQ
jgi:ketosteroid isomerase-like protein